MSNTTFEQAMEKADWMTKQGIKIETAEWTQTWESLLRDSRVHPVLHGKAIEALESEYAGLKASVDESTWMLESLTELAVAAGKDATEAA